MVKNRKALGRAKTLLSDPKIARAIAQWTIESGNLANLEQFALEELITILSLPESVANTK